ncbi:hypothetical protein CSW14_09385 [Thermus scotoductus]|jgi:hypothetical protein|uniref:Bacterial Pleckstrin homology domain-containing protein n=1 Tax=Thermus scotoductus TaxID=37636 RepID=A0A430VKS9_THESC|nr:hypothetical protein CSW14_09385 [Thermus scotoductus]
MRLHPKRDGNPKRSFLRFFVLSTLALLGLTFLAFQDASESLTLLVTLLVLGVLLLGAFLLWFSSLPERLSYELAGSVLTIHLPFGHRVVHRSEVAEVRPLSYALSRRIYRHKGEASMPGYHRKRLRLEGLPVEALVGARRGEGVLLVLKNGSGLLLNPEDPLPLLKWKEEA